MAFTLIIGPMKSGKSFELIARAAPYEFAGKKVVYVRPQRDVRNDGVQSRIGVKAKALNVASLKHVGSDADVIGIDEVHMFPVRDVDQVQRWLEAGKEVVASGLDVDYSGALIPVVGCLLALRPDVLISKVAVCEVCQRYNGHFTQILQQDQPILKGLPPVVPEDGSYAYQVRCRECFVSG